MGERFRLTFNWFFIVLLLFVFAVALVPQPKLSSDTSVERGNFLVNTKTIEPITIQGQEMVTADGELMRFWGMNLSSVYPSHEQSDHLAANLASLGLNVVRHHHLLRNSLDWNPGSKIGSLAAFNGNTRDPNIEAWDRFDYLNAQLRARGIYVMLTLEGSRRYLAGDADILQTNDQDRSDWMAAIAALNKMPGNLDLFKMLPMIDERAALLMEEFARKLLTHANPYTEVAYGNDPQVLYLETMNETSSEYAIIAGNKFESAAYPAISYWKTILNNKWAEFSAAKSIPPCEFFNPATTQQKLARGEFLRELDRNYFNRMKNVVRDLNMKTPMIFSNLWRGESFQKMQHELSDLIEDHQYTNPLVVKDFDDVFNNTTRSASIDKPYFIGELNQQEGNANLTANAPYRSMLLLAVSVYGSFNSWSGITWYAWAHGDRMLGKDGWSVREERWPSVPADMVGNMQSDGMTMDHLRTAGILFKKKLVAPSTKPLTLYVDDPTDETSYTSLMRPKYQFMLGWQNIHSIRRAFGPVPPSQPAAPWMTTSPSNPLVSDTGEIIKDTQRKQLTVAAPQAEAFSGFLDGQPPAGLTHVQISGSSGSATIIMVSVDGKDFEKSKKLIISRTGLDANNQEVNGPAITLKHLQAPSEKKAWYIKRTRPRVDSTYEQLNMSSSGELILPTDSWHEIELEYGKGLINNK